MLDINVLQYIIEQEGWKNVSYNNRPHVQTYDDIPPIPIKHPVFIHLALFKDHPDAAIRFTHLKRAYEILWPNLIWHDWTKRRFMAFTENYNYITLAAGASAAKSADTAAYAILFFFANPAERNVTIASVTMESLLTRVWGYLTSYIKYSKVQLPYKYFKSKPPKILYDNPAFTQSDRRYSIDDDTLHGIFSVTARLGDNDAAISTWIGKHPKDKILLVLDECTDMPLAITNATPNLNTHPEKFQLIGIGNSASTQDLHGTLSTPKAGWPSVSIKDRQWPTVQKNGICLYFSPYDSPAITDPDPERRKILSRFLVSQESLKAKEQELGTESEGFFRFVLGFWKMKTSSDVILTEKFLDDTRFYNKGNPEWSGYFPFRMVAGLDPAFSTKGDNAIFRVGVVGHTIDNRIVIDLGGEEAIHRLPILRNGGAYETQVAERALELLVRYGIPLHLLGVDVTGPGRALGALLEKLWQSYAPAFKSISFNDATYDSGAPLKIMSTTRHSKNATYEKDPTVLTLNSYDLWMAVRAFVEHNSVYGLDDKTKYQFTNRKIIETTQAANTQYRLESKPEYKRRTSTLGNPHSPDEADATAILVQVVLHRLGITPGTIQEAPRRLDRQVVEKLAIAGKLRNRNFDPLSPLQHGTSIGGISVNMNEVVNNVSKALKMDFSGTLLDHIKHSKPF